MNGAVPHFGAALLFLSDWICRDPEETWTKNMARISRRLYEPSMKVLSAYYGRWFSKIFCYTLQCYSCFGSRYARRPSPEICQLSSVIKKLENQASRITVFSLMTVLTDDSIFPLIFSFPHNFITSKALLFNCSTVARSRISRKKCGNICIIFRHCVSLRRNFV